MFASGAAFYCRSNIFPLVVWRRPHASSSPSAKIAHLFRSTLEFLRIRDPCPLRRHSYVRYLCCTFFLMLSPLTSHHAPYFGFGRIALSVHLTTGRGGAALEKRAPPPPLPHYPRSPQSVRGSPLLLDNFFLTRHVIDRGRRGTPAQTVCSPGNYRHLCHL